MFMLHHLWKRLVKHFKLQPLFETVVELTPEDKHIATERFYRESRKESVKYLSFAFFLKFVWLLIYVSMGYNNHWLTVTGACQLLACAIVLMLCKHITQSSQCGRLVDYLMILPLPFSTCFCLLTDGSIQSQMCLHFPEMSVAVGMYVNCGDRAYERNWAEAGNLPNVGRDHDVILILYVLAAYHLQLVVPQGYTVIAFILMLLLCGLAHIAGAVYTDVDVFWFCMAGILAVTTRKLRGRSQIQLFLAMQSLQREALHEKVLRCETEFKMEGMLGAKQMRGKPQRHIATASAKDTNSASSTAPSIFSAPAILGHHATSMMFTTCQGNDCLPGSYVVQVEDLNIPKELQSLEIGERILCFDLVGNMPAFVEVQDIRLNSAADAEWVDVHFTTGGHAIMTRDHPVHVMKGRYLSVVCAADLQSGDCLMDGMRSLLPVSHVRNCEAPAQTSVYLTIHQAQRYAVLVSPPLLYAALGSADLRPMALDQDKTFLRVESVEGDEEISTLRRSNSAPPSVFRNWVDHCTSCADDTHSVSFSGNDSYMSSADSAIWSNDDMSREVIVGKTLASSGSLGADGEVKLSDLLRLHSQGIQSIGSVYHEEMRCTPCHFVARPRYAMKNKNKNGCRAGHLCEYCHHHIALTRKQDRELLQRRLSATGQPTKTLFKKTHGRGGLPLTRCKPRSDIDCIEEI